MSARGSVLPEEEREPLKAILGESIARYMQKSTFKCLLRVAHDAITHPEHPLHPGKPGVDMFLGTLDATTKLPAYSSPGTFDTGEARLLLSSKQVDYIRYWLFAMNLTKRMVPLPYSDCLLTESSFKTISPINYINGPALHSAVKVNLVFTSFNPIVSLTQHFRISRKTIRG